MNKTQKITSEAAFRDVTEGLIKKRWDQRVILSPARVKQMFSQKGGPKLTKKQKQAALSADLAAWNSQPATDGNQGNDETSDDEDDASVGEWCALDEPDLLAPGPSFYEGDDFESTGEVVLG